VALVALVLLLGVVRLLRVVLLGAIVVALSRDNSRVRLEDAGAVSAVGGALGVVALGLVGLALVDL